jgi:hypothetical protein
MNRMSGAFHASNLVYEDQDESDLVLLAKIEMMQSYSLVVWLLKLNNI